MVATIIGGGMFALPVAFVHVVFKGLLVLSATGIDADHRVDPR
jgi:amino acid permease